MFMSVAGAVDPKGAAGSLVIPERFPPTFPGLADDATQGKGLIHFCDASKC